MSTQQRDRLTSPTVLTHHKIMMCQGPKMAVRDSKMDKEIDQTTDRLARKVLATLSIKPAAHRVVIGISGVPGSGKTTLAAAVCAKINSLYAEAESSRNSSGTIATAIPMDGFHYSRAHLATMPDPTTAIHRRGAAFTFDAAQFYTLVHSLVQPIDPQTTITAPSFDHAVKDPAFNSIQILPSIRVVLIEGNYCALNRTPWKEAALLMDELWFVDTPKEVAWKRLAKRHLASGIVQDQREALDRARGTDELNAEDIRNNRLEVHEIVL